MIDATLADSALTDALARYLVPVVAIGGGLLFAAFIVACGVMRSISVSKAKESTKRELAAYVAEGSIHPDDAVRILAAGHDDDKDLKAARCAVGGANRPAGSPQVQEPVRA